MIITMNLKPEPFGLIKQGTKTIEMRLFDEKRKHIRVGDFIEFINLDNKEKLLTRVIGVHVYPTFKELYNDYNKIELGYSAQQEASYTDMLKYYSLEEQEANCVVGLEIRLADDSELDY